MAADSFMRPRRLVLLVLLLLAGSEGTARAQLGSIVDPLVAPVVSIDPLAKLDPLALQRAQDLTGRSRLIVRAIDTASPGALTPLIASLGGTLLRTLVTINAQAVELPDASIVTLAASPIVARISLDRLSAGAMERTGAAIRATSVRDDFGYDGRGVGIAAIDSGVTPWHDDLGAAGGQRVHAFVDFVNGRATPYDDNGHGTHVAGILAGNGFDSSGKRTGIAPGAHLVVLKVLDASGRGHISDVIAALEYVISNRHALSVRIVNLSIATGVYESFTTDPLTLAARRAVEAGLVVVAASGNRGRNENGRNAYGGVTAPGNAPWVLTVGASSHSGTVSRSDDVMAAFSSRGPSAVDYAAKPDLVAPGVGIESLSDPDSALYESKAAYLLPGTVPTTYLPYLSLSGTSMSAPVVAGTVALMLQANPAMTPNQVKAILQYTAEVYPRYDPLTEGAGFLNARGAVTLATAFASNTSDPHPVLPGWSGRLIWGNQLASGGRLTRDATAWPADVLWGAASTPSGEEITWGVVDRGRGLWDRWRATRTRNVVWGSACGGADCDREWSVEDSVADESVVWGTEQPESVVWGTAAEESVVWGTHCGDAACEPALWPQP